MADGGRGAQGAAMGVARYSGGLSGQRRLTRPKASLVAIVVQHYQDMPSMATTLGAVKVARKHLGVVSDAAQVPGHAARC